MNAGYPEKRASVTHDIKKTLLNLLEQEQDFQKKKKHPAKWYQAAVATELKLKDEDNPSVRSYEEAMVLLKKELAEPNPLEAPWTLGVCSSKSPYSSFFPPDSLAPLIKQKNWYDKTRSEDFIKTFYNELPKEEREEQTLKEFTKQVQQNKFTVRNALWMVKLSQLAIQYYPNLKSEIVNIAADYADCERISELLGEEKFDTSSLDTIYFKEIILDTPEDFGPLKSSIIFDTSVGHALAQTPSGYILPKSAQVDMDVRKYMDILKKKKKNGNKRGETK